jgi:hypothetical protein
LKSLLLKDIVGQHLRIQDSVGAPRSTPADATEHPGAEREARARWHWLSAVFLAVRVIVSFMVGVWAGDPATFGTVVVLLLGVALAASCVPSLRALRTGSMAVLRAD